MTRGTWCSIIVAAVLLSPASAFAQAISGVVTDSTGGVVPGVSVEAASPALIEQTRTVVTNEAGRYTIVSLRPGTYSVTFTLAGFNTVTRDGITLTSDFTATVNTQLATGGVNEAITVTGEAPVVDVQNLAQPRTYVRDELDALPTGRSPADLIDTLPGATPGFFGTAFRGSQDSLTMVDGMRATLMIGAGPGLTTAPSSSNMYQEFSYSTAIDSAEIGQPGLRVNLIPRDGGNEFHSSVFFNYTNDNWQASNIDDELFAAGLRTAKTLKRTDFNPTFGGPLARNKLWFQSTYQYTNQDNQVLNNFADADPNPFVYVADVGQPAINKTSANSFVQRLTWQAAERDKVSGFYSWSDSKTPFFYSAVFGPAPLQSATAELRSGNNHQAGGRWTRTQTQRLLLEASFLRSTNRIVNSYRDPIADWSAPNVESGLPTTLPAEYSVFDIGIGREINMAPISDGNISTANELRAAATYVTGSHSWRAGLSFFSGSYHRPTIRAGYATLRVLNGVPNEVGLQLPGNERDNIDGDWGLFVQDRWTRNRLTVNAGLRMDVLQSSVPAQVLPASPWLPEQRFAAQDVLNYKDLSPRLGAVYDLFGNGKTAVKVALARFVAGETVNLTGLANPIRTIGTTDTRQWTDLNGDRTIYNPDMSIQLNELGPSSNRTFGQPTPATTFDPEALGGWFNRGYSWETNVSVQHELLPRVGVTALFYRRSQGNLRTNDNLAIDPSAYDGPFCVTAPMDPRLPGGGGFDVCGLYDIKPEFLGRVQNFNTFSKNVGNGEAFKNIVTGWELTVNARLARGAFLQGGLNLQKVLTSEARGGGFGTPVINPCNIIDNPETRFCENESPYRPDISLNGLLPLPLDFAVSGVYQGISGPNVTAVLPATNAVIAPALGRPLAGGATKAIHLIEPNQEYLPMRHVFDLRITKLLRFDRYRVNLMADLYNAFNDNAVSGILTTFGPAWQVPIGVSSPRQFRLSAQFDF